MINNNNNNIDPSTKSQMNKLRPDALLIRIIIIHPYKSSHYY